MPPDLPFEFEIQIILVAVHFTGQGRHDNVGVLAVVGIERDDVSQCVIGVSSAIKGKGIFVVL